MKGLLIKDIKLLAEQKRTLLVVFIVGLFVMASKENTDSGVGYFSILVPIFAVSTLSYDEFDNGMAFLMTLPVSRKIYVREKYALGILCVCAVCILSTAAAFVINLSIRHIRFSMDLLYVNIAVSACALLLISILLPLIIKFGSEKYRMILLAGCGIGSLAVFGLVQAAKYFRLNTAAAFETALQANGNVIAAAAAAGCFAVFGISYAVSVQIMKKKEF